MSSIHIHMGSGTMCINKDGKMNISDLIMLVNQILGE